MAITPPAQRIWWKEPIERVELVWIVIAFLWGLFMFGFMIAWHFIGQQNLSKEAYRIAPSAYEAKVDEFAKKYKVREEQGKEPVPWGDEPYQRTPGIFLNSQATARFLSALTERPQGSNVVDVPAAPKKRALPPAPVVLASPRTRAAIALVKSNMPAEHERYSRRLSKREARMKKKLAKLWRDVEREMVARMREALVGNGSRAYYELHPQGAAATLMLRSKSVADEFVFDIATVSADLGKLWKEHDVETALDEAAVVARQFAFDNVLPEESVMLQNWAGTRAERFSFAVTQQAADELRQTLNDGTLASETLDELVERVSGVFENKQGYEAERIARTESATASIFIWVFFI